MPSLAELQEAFSRALCDSDLPAPPHVRRDPAATSSRRFDVYRNNRAVNLIEVLESHFAAVRRLVGDEYFQAVARTYIDRHPPRAPVLLLYGRRFGDFLESVPSAAAVPYLGDVARLEWARLDALHAADAEPAGIEQLGAAPEALLNDVTLTTHPSVNVVASRWPVVSLWSASLDPDNAGEVNMKQPEEAVVVRPALRVGVHRSPPGGVVFMDALRGGSTLGTAAGQTMESDEAFDLAGCLQFLFRIGAVAAVNLPDDGKPS